jgi:drug/metabolite transporter (DMT)-like permease
MFGLQIMLGATASLLLNFETLFTALIAWLFFKEHTTHRLVWGMILILFGGLLLSGSIDFHSKQLLGYALITGACLMWALDNNFTRHIATADPLLIVGVKSLLAGIFNIMVILLWGIKFIFSLKIVLSSLLIGAVSYGLSLVCFILALRYIGTGRTSAYFSSAPFIGSLFSIIFLKEPFSFTWLFSGILMGCGIWLHMTERHEHEHSHEALVHEHSHTHDEHHQHEHSCSAPSSEPHSHLHEHKPLRHRHTHSPDIHHRHGH